MEKSRSSTDQGKKAFKSIQEWWPDRLDLRILRQYSRRSNPMNKAFDYRKEFNSLDFAAVKRDIAKLLKESQDWWPVDF